MVKHLIDKLIGKTKKVKKAIKIGAFLFSVGVLTNLASGCNPMIYEEPSEPSSKPVSTPTTEPTSTPEPTPTPLPDYIDISGRLENCEKDGIGKEGIIRLKNPADNSLIGEYSVNGDFSFTLDKTVDEFPEGITLEAFTGTSSNPDSYIRTIHLPAGDNNPITIPTGNPAIRVVPYPNFDTDNDGDIDETDYENFKQHAEDGNIKTYTLGDYKERGLIKSIIRNVEILKENPEQNEIKFTSEKQELMKNKTQDINDIRKYVEGDEINVQVDGEGNSHANGNHYSVNESGKIIDVEPGWTVVCPKDLTDGHVGMAYVSYLNNSAYTGTVNRSLIQIDIDLGTIGINTVYSHEEGHSFIFPLGHSDLPHEVTIMREVGNFLSSPGDADVKTSYIVNEKTYQPRETSDDILGL